MHTGYVVAIAVLVFLQTAVIVGLLVQRSRRRGMEAVLQAGEERSRVMADTLRRSHQRNQDLAGRLIAAQEAERTRIARDLHDDLSQQVAGLSIGLSGLRRRINAAGRSAEVDEAFTLLQQRTATLAEQIRTLSHDLHPGVLKHAGLAAALKAHCAEFERQQSIEMTFNADDDLDSLDPNVALCLFRVAQEALSNTARHAQAHSAQVRVTRTGEGIELTVMDDGIGFDARHGSGGIGLQSIDERVRLTRGMLTIDSQPGQGTKLLVQIPLLTSV